MNIPYRIYAFLWLICEFVFTHCSQEMGDSFLRGEKKRVLANLILISLSGITLLFYYLGFKTSENFPITVPMIVIVHLLGIWAANSNYK